MLFVVLTLTVFVTSAASQGCEFPSNLVGVWDSSVGAWQDLTISNTTIQDLPVGGMGNMPFACYLQNDTAFIIQSPDQEVAGTSFHFYTCLDIVPVETTVDVVYFHVRTDPNTRWGGAQVKDISTGGDKSFSAVCDSIATQFPLEFSVFLRKGFENNLGNNSCPRGLQGEFAGNLTDPLENSKCPDGFVLDGCDTRNLLFNYTDCGGNYTSLGTASYACLNTLEVENVTYTTVYTSPSEGAQVNAFEFACLEQTMADGQLSITKSGGACGATPSVQIMANETMSCRTPTTMAPEGTTTPSDEGRNTTVTVSVTTPGSGNGGQGGGANDESAALAVIPGVASLLVPAWCLLMAAFP